MMTAVGAMTAKRVVAACAMLAITLAGCTPANVLGPHHEVTKTDEHRRDVMLTEPVLKLAVVRPTVQPGERMDPNQWNRGRIEASLMKNQDPLPDRRPEDVRNKIREALRIMRAGGWLTLYSECDPPVHFDSQGLSPSPAPTASPQADLAEHAWSWRLYLYRIRDGVSYWTEISGTARKSGTGYTTDLSLDLVAPQEHDPADLFPDRPPGLRDADICLLSPRLPRTPEMSGKPVIVEASMIQSRLDERRRTPDDRSRR